MTISNEILVPKSPFICTRHCDDVGRSNLLLRLERFFCTFTIMERGGYICILTNKNNTTLYIGVTSSLFNRIYEHKTKKFKTSFTAKYNLDKLVYFEVFSNIKEAIAREKQLKAGSRKKKVALINAKNSDWLDLFNDIEDFN